jgi:DNA (cytosine-5)-methyltransferase 1
MQFHTLSLFSGAGGLEIANQHVCTSDNSHFKTVACVEIEKDRCDTLRGYFGESFRIYQQDIRQVSVKSLLDDCHIQPHDISLVYGGPPCQSFSQAGKQKGQHDPRGELIFEFLRAVKEINPPLFMMENVSNLKGIDKGRLLDAILAEMSDMGYHVTYGVLNSAHYGNAQKRQRLIFLGVDKKFNQTLDLPEPTHVEHQDLFGKPQFKTVAQALIGLPEKAD